MTSTGNPSPIDRSAADTHPASKVAIVTGAASGIGAATALRLARLGYRVVINYSRSREQAEEVQQACAAAGAEAFTAQGDVADDAACRALARQALDRWGRIDALVNNAGVTTFVGTDNWDAIDADAFRRIIDVNAMGTFQMVRACAPALRQSQGAIVNVSSIAGALGIGSSLPYVASKGAMNSMTLFFARNLAPHVRVNAVCPGLVTSDWFVKGVGQEKYDKLRAGYEQSTPLGRASTPDDVADAVVWLVHGARTTTGELLLLDSGTHLGRAPGAVAPRS